MQGGALRKRISYLSPEDGWDSGGGEGRRAQWREAEEQGLEDPLTAGMGTSAEAVKRAQGRPSGLFGFQSGLKTFN
jgi:hypothetical protein